VTKACVDNADCKKGLLCTARCLGDSGCITGCFARFGNEVLNDLLQCSIEDEKCINIAIIPPGAQPPEEVPLPPKALTSGFKPTSLDGTWYKVLGWNRQYDCFDCQKNTFQTDPDGETAVMDVDFSMAAKRSGRRETSNRQQMREKVNFDKEVVTSSTGEMLKSRRSAHTQGRMFGLTFWENWYVLGENKPTESPFKFVYYTGKTLQNTYSGAFVYARTPEVPEESMESIYRLARDAGMDPTKFCRIRNACFLESKNEAEASAAIEEMALSVAASGSPSVGEDIRRFTTSIDAPLQLKARALWYDVLDYIEDPHDAAKWMFNQQVKMEWPSEIFKNLNLNLN